MNSSADRSSIRSRLAEIFGVRHRNVANYTREDGSLAPDVSIEIRNVHKSFDGVGVLQGINLTMVEGAITTILGPSGTGKSVLLKHLIGLLEPDEGEVLIRGENLWRLPPRTRRERCARMGMLFQDGGMLGSLSIYDNTALPLRYHTDLTEREIRPIVIDRLTAVGLEDSLHKLPSEISGGMRKRAAFARALVMDPSIVFFDEPDSGLDPIRTSLLNELITKMHSRQRATYVIVTHHIATARQVSDYIALMWMGKVVLHDSVDEVFASKDPFVRQFLTGDTAGPVGMN